MGLEIILFSNDLDDDGGGGDIREDDRNEKDDDDDRVESNNRLDERKRSVWLMTDEMSAMHINNKRTGRVVTVTRLDGKAEDGNDCFLLLGLIVVQPGIGKLARDCADRTEKHHGVDKTAIRSAHEMPLSPVAVEMSTLHPRHVVVDHGGWLIFALRFENKLSKCFEKRNAQIDFLSACRGRATIIIYVRGIIDRWIKYLIHSDYLYSETKQRRNFLQLQNRSCEMVSTGYGSVTCHPQIVIHVGYLFTVYSRFDSFCSSFTVDR